MKKLNFQGITSGLNDLSTATDSNSKAGYNETIDVTLIDLAPKNNYATDDNEDAYLSLAASIESAGLLTPLGVIKNGNRYTLFSGERRFRAITQYLHWPSVSCYVFEGNSCCIRQMLPENIHLKESYSFTKNTSISCPV